MRGVCVCEGTHGLVVAWGREGGMQAGPADTHTACMQQAPPRRRRAAATHTHSQDARAPPRGAPRVLLCCCIRACSIPPSTTTHIEDLDPYAMRTCSGAGKSGRPAGEERLRKLEEGESSSCCWLAAPLLLHAQAAALGAPCWRSDRHEFFLAFDCRRRGERSAVGWMSTKQESDSLVSAGADFHCSPHLLLLL